MNEKIQAILLQIVTQLKQLKWTAHKDWELTIKSDGHIPMTKNISVHSGMGNEEWDDQVDTTIVLKLTSQDEITYFPEFTVSAQINTVGVPTKDVNEPMQGDVAFTEEDFSNQKKAKLAAQHIDRFTTSNIQEAYDDYFSANSEEITAYKAGGWRADYDPER